MAQNYTLGRGKIYFSRFKPGTQVPVGFDYIGNSPELAFNIESENLDHYNSDEGIREKDDSVPLEVNRTGSFSTDHISPENIANFFFSDGVSAVTVAAATGVTYTITGAKKGKVYQIGWTDANPSGARDITTVSVEADPSGTPATLVAGTDYTVDLATGLLTLLATGSAFTDGDDVEVTYNTTAHERTRVSSGSQPVEGAMMYIAKNPKGADFHYAMPWVKLTPNGDFNLKGDEWQVIPFSIEILKKEGAEAITVDGRKFAM